MFLDIPFLERHTDWETLTNKLEIFWSCLYVLSKTWANFMFFLIKFKKKILSKKSSFSTFLENQFSIFNENNLTMDHLTIWRRRKNFDLLQLIVFDIIKILLAFSYFSTYSEILSPPNFPLSPNWLLILLFLWMDIPFGSLSKFTAD